MTCLVFNPLQLGEKAEMTFRMNPHIQREGLNDHSNEPDEPVREKAEMTFR